MLSRTFRLTKMRDFDLLFEKGRFVGGKSVSMKIWKIDPEFLPKRGYTRDDLKIGFIVSKKIEKSAVKRNVIKRRMRESVRLLMKEAQLHKGFLVAIMAQAPIKERSFLEIQKEMQNLFKRAGLL